MSTRTERFGDLRDNTRFHVPGEPYIYRISRPKPYAETPDSLNAVVYRAQREPYKVGTGRRFAPDDQVMPLSHPDGNDWERPEPLVRPGDLNGEEAAR